MSMSYVGLSTQNIFHFYLNIVSHSYATIFWKHLLGEMGVFRPLSGEDMRSSSYYSYDLKVPHLLSMYKIWSFSKIY